jgi:hypothetical protein
MGSGRLSALGDLESEIAVTVHLIYACEQRVGRNSAPYSADHERHAEQYAALLRPMRCSLFSAAEARGFQHQFCALAERSGGRFSLSQMPRRRGGRRKKNFVHQLG